MAIRTTRHSLLLDVGGTYIKCSDGRSIPIDSGGSMEEIRSALKSAVGNLSGIREGGVAIPGPFDYKKGIFLMKHKFQSVYGESFASLVDSPASVRFRYMHDVNCMLLGELQSGICDKYDNVALISLGTGLGFSMSLNHQIQVNPSGSPLYTIFRYPYKDGILEDYVSKRGILKCYADLSGTSRNGISVFDLSKMARSGDKTAEECFSSTGHILGKEIRPILAKFNIQCLLFGGQISKSFDLMEEAVRSELLGIDALKSISPIDDIDDATFNGLRLLVS